MTKKCDDKKNRTEQKSVLKTKWCLKISRNKKIQCKTKCDEKDFAI